MKSVVIKFLKITNFRGIKNLSLNFINSVNVISGKNGCGKSSILDAIKYMFLTRNSNLKFINEDSLVDNNPPSVKMELLIDDEIYFFETFNKIWKINDIDYTASNYKKRMLEIFKIDDLNLIISKIDPHNWLEENLLSDKSGDSKKLRDSIIKALNFENENFNEENFNLIIEKINDLDCELKSYKNELKNYDLEIDNLKKDNPDLNFDLELEEDQKYDYDLYNQTTNQINEYNKLMYEIDSIQNQIQELIQEKKRLEVNNASNLEQSKGLNGKELFLTIITFGFYYFLVIKKRNKLNNKNNSHYYQELRDINDKVINYQAKADQLIAQKSKINYSEIKAKQEEIAYQKIRAEKNNEYNNRVLNKHKNLINLIDELENKINNSKLAKNQLEQSKLEILEKVSQTFQNAFRSFQISLSEEYNVLIKKNGIDFKNLNYSSKKNIVTEINDFLKRLININIFSVMDNIEAINHPEVKENNQYIFCKVTNEEELKLNGQNLN